MYRYFVEKLRIDSNLGENPQPSSPKPPKQGSAFDNQEVGRIESDTTIREIIVRGYKDTLYDDLSDNYENDDHLDEAVKIEMEKVEFKKYICVYV